MSYTPFSRIRVFFFFFSSRRRHTRFDCDWSSDVCSSDLVVRRRHRRAERGATAHLRQVAVELLDLGEHRLRNLEALLGDVKAVPHRTPHRVVALLHADVVAEEDLPVLRRRSEEHTSELQSQSNL